MEKSQKNINDIALHLMNKTISTMHAGALEISNNISIVVQKDNEEQEARHIADNIDKIINAIFKIKININILHGENTYLWDINGFTDNWKHTPLEHTYIPDCITGLLIKNDIPYIDALNYIFNYDGDIVLNTECSIGLGIILHYLLYHYFGKDKYAYLINGINRVILSPKFSQLINEIYGNAYVAKNVISAYYGYQYPLIKALFFQNDTQIVSTDSIAIDKRVSIGTCLYVYGESLISQSDEFGQFNENDKLIIKKLDSNAFSGQWTLVVDKTKDMTKYVFLSKCGIECRNGFNDIINSLFVRYDEHFKNLLKDNEFNISKKGKKYITNYIATHHHFTKYSANIYKIDKDLLNNLVSGERFDTELFRYSLYQTTFDINKFEKVFSSNFT